MARPGVMFYFDMLPALKRLTKVQKADLFEALLEYAQFGVLPEFDDVGVSVAWDFIQPRIDRDAEAYDLKCLKNQYSVYCREAKKNGQTPLSFDDWKIEGGQSNDKERCPSMRDDQEIETEKEKTEKISYIKSKTKKTIEERAWDDKRFLFDDEELEKSDDELRQEMIRKLRNYHS